MTCSLYIICTSLLLKRMLLKITSSVTHVSKSLNVNLACLLNEASKNTFSFHGNDWTITIFINPKQIFNVALFYLILRLVKSNWKRSRANPKKRVYKCLKSNFSWNRGTDKTQFIHVSSNNFWFVESKFLAVEWLSFLFLLL